MPKALISYSVVIKIVILWIFSHLLFVFQLSQPGASLDNRVPTPASAASADLHSQHVGADLPPQEVKTEPHHEQQEFEPAGGKTEPKMEVGSSACLCIQDILLIHLCLCPNDTFTLFL